MSRVVTRYAPSNPCPVCSTGTKGCSVTEHGLQFCRGEPGGGWRRLTAQPDAAGFHHYRKGEEPWQVRRWYKRPERPKIKPPESRPRGPVRDWDREAIRLTANLTPHLRTELARSLGVPTEATLGVKYLGYAPAAAHLLDGRLIDPGHWTFPEVDAAGKVVGVLRRYRKGCGPGDSDKLQMPGGARGLAVPIGWDDNPGPALVAEGWSDALTLAHCGLAGVGRPSNNSGEEQLARLLADWPADRDVVVLAENDRKADGLWPGRDGALLVAGKLARLLGRRVLVAFPPDGSKDVRDYLTAASWGENPWAERGLRLLEHLAATAEAIDPPGDADAAGADDSLGAVAAAVVESLTPTCWCQNVRVQIVERISTGKLGAVPFGCHRTTCPTCGIFKRRDLFESSESYLPRVTSDDPNAGGMTLRIAIVAADKVSAITHAVRKLDGEYLAIPTADPDGCRGAAGFDVRHVGEDSTCRTSPRVLVATVTPGDRSPHAECTEVAVAEAFRAIGHALTTSPTPPEGAKRVRAWTKSRGWGDELVREVSDVKVRCPAKFSHPDTEKILTELKAIVPFWFGDSTLQGKPLGIGGSPAQATCLALLLGGAGATTPPTIDKVVQLGREWLRTIPKEVGDGPRVRGVLREHLWFGTLGRIDQIRAELLDADDRDRREAATAAEVESIIRAVRDAYRGREHEAVGICRLALGLPDNAA